MILKTTTMENHEQEDDRARFERKTAGLTLEGFDEYVDRFFWNPVPAVGDDDCDMELPPWFTTHIFKRP